MEVEWSRMVSLVWEDQWSQYLQQCQAHLHRMWRTFQSSLRILDCPLWWNLRFFLFASFLVLNVLVFVDFMVLLYIYVDYGCWYLDRLDCCDNLCKYNLFIVNRVLSSSLENFYDLITFLARTLGKWHMCSLMMLDWWSELATLCWNLMLKMLSREQVWYWFFCGISSHWL